MKHTIPVTVLLLVIFVLAQVNGLFVLDYYIDVKESALAGKTIVHQEAYDQSNITVPVVENESSSFVYIIIALLLGTGLVLLIVKFRQRKLWKAWFFLSVVVTLVISLNTWTFRFFGDKGVSALSLYGITLAICCLLAYFKVFRQNIFFHNITEIFIYGGLSALLVPILNMISISVVLLVVACYDMYAVWKSKHMIAMAQFQTDEKVFAGLYIPYKRKEEGKVSSMKKIITEKIPKAQMNLKKTTKTINTAILGGGDVAFPLLFAGVVMKTTGSYLAPAIVVATTTISLALLFYYGEKGKFYPAIPFVATGCFVGYGLFLLI
ncbi:hypothetical protein HZA99_00915 [Candidatus Woesearchaeota archaeon]|nr:hypothetical protein [Candidatus Woesearchaeota archaeon]